MLASNPQTIKENITNQVCLYLEKLNTQQTVPLIEKVTNELFDKLSTYVNLKSRSKDSANPQSDEEESKEINIHKEVSHELQNLMKQTNLFCASKEEQIAQLQTMKKMQLS